MRKVTEIDIDAETLDTETTPAHTPIPLRGAGARVGSRVSSASRARKGACCAAPGTTAIL